VGGVRVIRWPFHGGLPDIGMGAGPAVLARGLGHPGGAVAPADAGLPEAARIFELDRRLASAVRSARDDDALPLVLAGGCMSALGTVAGAGARGLGVVWLDAHADFDTPDDNLSGFFDVFALAILTGSGWRALRETIPGFTPVPEDRVLVAGVRDLEPYQRDRLERSGLRTLPGAFAPTALRAALEPLAEQVDRVYLHVDLDVLDVREGRANEYAASGGPTLATVLDAVDAVFDRFDVAAVALTAYDPAEDSDGRARTAARRILARVAARVGR
jgi:arginase